MSNFNFSTLNSTDLEEFVCDLLNAQEKSNNNRIIYRTFKEGKDKGIDFLYSTPLNQYSIVGQVKHYFRSGFNLRFVDFTKRKKELSYTCRCE